MIFSSLSGFDAPLAYPVDDLNRDGKRGCLGHIRGDFGLGTGFWLTWRPHSDDREFCDRFQSEHEWAVRFLHNTLFRSIWECRKYCEAYLPRTFGSAGYGLRAEEGKYVYIVRVNPSSIDEPFYIYIYDRERLSSFSTERRHLMEGEGLNGQRANL